MDKDPRDELPALYGHCETVYKAMLEAGKLQKPYDDSENVATVYEGFITRFVTETLHFSVPMYTKIMTQLKRMDCVRQLRRGGSTTPSRWLIVQPPSPDLWANAIDTKAKPSSPQDTIQQQLRDLNKRVTALELQHKEVD